MYPKKRGICWFKDCTEKYELCVKILVRYGKGHCSSEMKACKKHFPSKEYINMIEAALIERVSEKGDK